MCTYGMTCMHMGVYAYGGVCMGGGGGGGGVCMYVSCV